MAFTIYIMSGTDMISNEWHFYMISNEWRKEHGRGSSNQRSRVLISVTVVTMTDVKWTWVNDANVTLI